MITLLYIALEAVAVLLLLQVTALLAERRCGGINILSDLWC